MSKAVKMLLAEEVDPSIDVISALKDLHPPEASPSVPPCPASVSFDFLPQQKAVNQFPAGSSGGPSGLRPSHLKQCLSCKQSTLCVALAKFANRLAAGDWRSLA